MTKPAQSTEPHARPGEPDTARLAQVLAQVLAHVRAQAEGSGLFGEVTLEGGVLSCAAPSSSAPAFYRVFVDVGQVWVALVTPDRYLSQSIEQDLVHTGDKMSELLHDELIDVEHPEPYAPKVEHFRDQQKLFTFRSALPQRDLVGPVEAAADRVWRTLRAYEACFSELGDVDAGDDEG
jgi:hypothetical protein